MRVAYFSNQFATASGHGVARYAHELFDALRSHASHEIIPVAAWSSLKGVARSQLVNRTGLQFTGLGRRATPLAWTYLDWPPLERLMRQTPDLIHAVSLGYPISTRKPYVVTVHDLGHLSHPEYFNADRPWIMERSLRQAERQADAVICVSHFTAGEVVDRVGPHIESRIRVIHEGVDRRFFEAVDGKCLNGLALPPEDVPIILTAGKISPRKNVHGVITAMAGLLDQIPHHLVHVGGVGWDAADVTRELARSGMSARTHLIGYVSDEQLRALYSRAAIYVHPSFYEGFGLTVLEAMAARTPVVTSDRTSLPEIAGDAALLVDPESTDELSDAILLLATDADLALSLSQKGRQRARQFEWSACARQVSEVYKEVSAQA